MNMPVVQIFEELSDEEYNVLSPIQKAQYKRMYNKHHGIVSETKRIPLATYKGAIKQNCLECAGESRTDVTYCPITSCAFYSLRPFQVKDNGEEEAEQ